MIYEVECCERFRGRADLMKKKMYKKPEIFFNAKIYMLVKRKWIQ
jgi:hypothetical protein